MILTHKRLLVDVFLTRRLSKPLAFCESASVNFEPWHVCAKSSGNDKVANALYCCPGSAWAHLE